MDIGRRLVAESPQVHEYQSRLATAHYFLAEALVAAGNAAEAEQQYRESMRLSEAVMVQFPDVAFSKAFVDRSYEGLARLFAGTPRAAEAEQLRRTACQQCWDRELTTLNRAVDEHPGSAHALGRRAEWLLAHGRFAEADLALERLVETFPEEHWHWYLRACVLAYLGREDPYRALCRAMLDRFAGATDFGTLERTTKAALLLPAAREDDVRRLLRLAEQASQLAPESPWSALLKGLAECRAGHHTEAIEWLEKCRSAPSHDYGSAARVVAAAAYAALARQQSGQVHAARADLEHASGQAAAALPQFDSGELNQGGIENWLIAQIALREANVNVLGTPPSDSAQATGPPVPPLPPRPLKPSPFRGIAMAIPGVVQAEDFDEGGEGLAYHDTTYQDSGNQTASVRYRMESVEVDDCNDTVGGLNIGGILAGEWLAYTVEVQQAGAYELDLRYCSPSGGRLHIEFDGTDRTGPVELATTGWGNWSIVTTGSVRLAVGRQVMRIVFDAGGSTDAHVCNLNWIEARRVPQPESPSESPVDLP